MKTITLSGFIEYSGTGRWDKIKLIQENGLKIDLVGRFQEAIECFGEYGVQVNYWICDDKHTKSEMVEGWLKQLYGHVEAEYGVTSFNYSSWTSGTDYDTELTIGGHDLFEELRGKQGKFILLEMNFKD